MKQQMLEFLSSNPLSSLLALTNQGFFIKECALNPLNDPYHGCHVLNKNDDATNWENFWAFQSRAMAIAQHLHGSSNTDKLKANLEKAKSSLDSALQANIILVGDNSNLKGRVLDLEVEMKALEKCALDVKALDKSNKEEVARL